VLNWLQQFSTFCFLDNNEYQALNHQYECIVAAGATDWISVEAGSAFDELKEFANKNDGWLFGHLAYDLKNETEQLQSNHLDAIGFNDLHFFCPEILLLIGRDVIHIASARHLPQYVWNTIEKEDPITNARKRKKAIPFKSRFTLFEYRDAIEQLQQHITRGDCYEINFCQEFFAEEVSIHPAKTYAALSTISPMPFAAFYRHEHRYLLCASPERYLQKKGKQLLSQPIKGTWKRNLTNEEEDRWNKTQLQNNTKERSENVMVVDLVRNDLSKVCSEGTVNVEELFGVYSFPQVHQMISTISGTLKDALNWTDALKATFPMGSMTGAPKKRVMELIEQYEKTRRGIFSGAVGYITPDRNFDFNVVIRSILYNTESQYLSYQVGSGITYYSDAEKEYEECLLKAAAIRQVLE
jgi:para-aminobenzoate synthetase component 1